MFGFSGPSPLNAPYDFTRLTYNDVDASREAIRSRDFAAEVMEPMLGGG